MLLLRAPAKLNLGLRILARRSDGYHEIETVFLPLRLFDRIEVVSSPSPGIFLEVRNADLPSDERNLALRAAELACHQTGLDPALRIRLEKSIPIAAGLGGGSSDAAAMILGVEHLAGKPLPEPTRRELALQLGADVPYFLDPRPALGRGLGERLEPIPGVPEMWWLLIVFPFPVSTAEAYRAASAELTLPQEGSSIAALLGPSGVTSSPLNDLEIAVARRHPEIRAARRALERAGARVTGMSGSGPTVYGYFPTRGEAETAARLVKPPQGAGTLVVSSPGSASGDWGWGVAKW
jgi:4-diphosphocytidyl-2-C-methyl-D-erythritol kinase